MADAYLVAVTRWSDGRVPERPAAWLEVVARNRAIDLLRRQRTYAAKLTALENQEQTAIAAVNLDEPNEDLPDERLRLFVMCCHPALAMPSQVALTLRCLAGLTTPEIARLLLSREPAIAQRIVRAKRTIRNAGIVSETSNNEELSLRLPSVLAVLYLMFTEGYSATVGTKLMRADLSEQAISLARVLHALLSDKPETGGLLGLMLLTDARRLARTDADGQLVLLSDQDRTKWNQESIKEGRVLTITALKTRSPGPYTLQAAIAAVHADAETAKQTDWVQIIALYNQLVQQLPSPIVKLNRVIAISMVEGPQIGLNLIHELSSEEALTHSHLLPATCADFLRQLGKIHQASIEYERALELVTNTAERDYLKRRLNQIKDNA